MLLYFQGLVIDRPQNLQISIHLSTHHIIIFLPQLNIISAIMQPVSGPIKQIPRSGRARGFTHRISHLIISIRPRKYYGSMLDKPSTSIPQTATSAHQIAQIVESPTDRVFGTIFPASPAAYHAVEI
jgi:hypothetical protein